MQLKKKRLPRGTVFGLGKCILPALPEVLLAKPLRYPPATVDFWFFPQQKIDEYASSSGAEDGSGKYTKNWPLVEARRDCSTFIPPWPRAVRCVGWHVHRENAIGAPSGQCGVSTSISALSSVFQVFFKCFGFFMFVFLPFVWLPMTSCFSFLIFDF